MGSKEQVSLSSCLLNLPSRRKFQFHESYIIWMLQASWKLILYTCNKIFSYTINKLRIYNKCRMYTDLTESINNLLLLLFDYWI